MASVYEALRKASSLPTTKELNNKSFTDKLIKRNEQLIIENKKLKDKNEELLTLYTTEREVKEDYKSIIKEVRKYVKSNCIVSDVWKEIENNKFVPIGKVNYKSLSSKKVKELLEILDKVGDIKC